MQILRCFKKWRFLINFHYYLKKILSQRGYTANNKHNQSTLTANTDSLDFYESCSSYQRCTISKPVIKKFAIFTEKQLCWSLFSSKVAILYAWNLIKKRLQDRCFLVNIENLLITPGLKNTCKRLLLVSRRQKRLSYLNEVFISLLTRFTLHVWSHEDVTRKRWEIEFIRRIRISVEF